MKSLEELQQESEILRNFVANVKKTCGEDSQDSTIDQGATLLGVAIACGVILEVVE